MSKIRTMLENQVFYRTLAAQEWNWIKGNFSNIQLDDCLKDSHRVTVLKMAVRTI